MDEIHKEYYEEIRKEELFIEVINRIYKYFPWQPDGKMDTVKEDFHKLICEND